MIDGHTVLALITARGGSKGLPRKNIRDLGGKPLLAWTAEAAGHSRYIDRTILSSDDQEIIKIGLQYGCECPFIRPAELASDGATTMDAVHHALANIENKYEYIVLLQPTSPFRSAEDIDNCLELCLSVTAPACVSVTECEKNPYWMYSVTEDGRMNPLIPRANRPQRRQELPKAFVLNGAIYVAQSKWLSKQDSFVQEETVAYVMPQERSLDIDTLQDFQRAQFLIEKENNHGSDTAKIHRLYSKQERQ